MKFNYLTTLALGGVMTLTMAAPVKNEVSKPNNALATRDVYTDLLCYIDGFIRLNCGTTCTDGQRQKVYSDCYICGHPDCPDVGKRDMEEIAKRVPQNKPPSLDQSFCQIQWSIEHTGGGRQLTDEEIKVATETCLACEGQTTC